MKSEAAAQNTVDCFNGETLHPSLDIKDGILCLGFRYRSTEGQEEKISLIVYNGNITLLHDDVVRIADKDYEIDHRKRVLVRLEEKWGGSALNKFILRYNDLKQEPPSLVETFEEVVKLIKRYVALDHDIDYYNVAAWILGTYFFPIFYAYPFLHIKAPKRSGKSQLLNLLSQLCFNAVKSRPSLAAMADTVDALRGTYLIDQANSLERKGNEDLQDILADSYKRGGGKRRVIMFDKNKSRSTIEFETYSPKAFASVKELPEDLRDRCLVVPLIRSQVNFADPDESAEILQTLRGQIYEILIRNYPTVEAIYTLKKHEYRTNPEMFGRSLELWLPFEVVLMCFGMKNKIIEAKQRFKNQYGFSEYEVSEVEEEVIKAIIALLGDEPEGILSPKSIGDALKGSLFIHEANSRQRSANAGWAIKKFNLASKDLPRSKEGKRYLFEKTKVQSILASYVNAEPTPTSLTAESQALSRDGQITNVGL